MKNLRKLLKGHKYIVFMDFEGTQFSHEMIAIGAIATTLDSKNRIKRMKEPFKLLVKPKNKVGKYVVELTGISDEELKDKGVIFSRAMNEFKTYCAHAFKKATFVTFGSHDLKILTSSISYTLDYPKDVTSQIQKNFFDFTSLLNEFVKDDNNNALSLLHACEMFHVTPVGEHHDPSADAVNLALLYDAFIKEKAIVLDRYIKVLEKTPSLPEPIHNLIKEIYAGKEVNLSTLEKYCKDYIDD